MILNPPLTHLNPFLRQNKKVSKKKNRRWQCIGDTNSTIWSNGVMAFTGCRCRISLPHICRHTYCSNMAKFGMTPKTPQYLMGHRDISVTPNTYTHLGLEDATDELKWMNWRMRERNWKRTERRSPYHRKCSGQFHRFEWLCALLR